MLLEDPALSYHAKQRVGETDCFDNHLILIEHSLWLRMMRDRLELLKFLKRSHSSLWEVTMRGSMAEGKGAGSCAYPE